MVLVKYVHHYHLCGRILTGVQEGEGWILDGSLPVTGGADHLLNRHSSRPVSDMGGDTLPSKTLGAVVFMVVLRCGAARTSKVVGVTRALTA